METTLVAPAATVVEAMVAEAEVAEAAVVAAEVATVEVVMTTTEVETTTEVVVVEVAEVSETEAAVTKIVTPIPATTTGVAIKAPLMVPGERALVMTTQEALIKKKQDVAVGLHVEAIKRHQTVAQAPTRHLNRTQTRMTAQVSAVIVEATGSEVVAEAVALTNHQVLLPTRKPRPCM